MESLPINSVTFRKIARNRWACYLTCRRAGSCRRRANSDGPEPLKLLLELSVLKHLIIDRLRYIFGQGVGAHKVRAWIRMTRIRWIVPKAPCAEIEGMGMVVANRAGVIYRANAAARLACTRCAYREGRSIRIGAVRVLKDCPSILAAVSDGIIRIESRGGGSSQVFAVINSSGSPLHDKSLPGPPVLDCHVYACNIALICSHHKCISTATRATAAVHVSKHAIGIDGQQTKYIDFTDWIVPDVAISVPALRFVCGSGNNSGWVG